MIFANRQEAGRLLSNALSKLKLDPLKTIIVGIPRGGILVAKEISDDLAIPLTVLIIKKLTVPKNPELAIGATASFSKPVLDRWLIRDLKVPPDYVKREILSKKKEAKKREEFLNIDVDYEAFKGKVAVVVDDGVATGQTVKAASLILCQFGTLKLILAVPCASPSTIETLSSFYDEIICLEKSQDFWAVGQFYKDFRPVEDAEVKKLLTPAQLTIDN